MTILQKCIYNDILHHIKVSLQIYSTSGKLVRSDGFFVTSCFLNLRFTFH